MLLVFGCGGVTTSLSYVVAGFFSPKWQFLLQSDKKMSVGMEEEGKNPSFPRKRRILTGWLASFAVYCL